jgi:threonine/homoserine efflux transporter RhtA
VIGVVVLSQLPSALDLVGILLVMVGVAIHREVQAPQPAAGAVEA